MEPYAGHRPTNLGINRLRTGGTKNHIHTLMSVLPTKLRAQVIRDRKANSSQHLNEIRRFAQQDGYAAISLRRSMTGRVSQYVASKEEHYRRVPFEIKYKALVDKVGVTYDPLFSLRLTCRRSSTPIHATKAWIGDSGFAAGGPNECFSRRSRGCYETLSSRTGIKFPT